MSQTLTIATLGAQGDGIAETPQGPVFVPFALPGETVRAEVGKGKAVLEEVLTPAPERAVPACRHFTDCGGCAAQHLGAASYAEWKREKLVRALTMRGIEAEVAPLIGCPPASRRRVTFTARKLKDKVLLGYNAAQSHRIVDIEECPISLPVIVAAKEDIRQLAGVLAATPKPFRITVTATATGLDISVDGAGRLGEKQGRKAVDLALGAGFARVVAGGETLVESARPKVIFGGIAVSLPPGGFLQAVEAAEEAMAGLVGDHLAGSNFTADLFAGSGTFALRLARQGRVHAVEGDAAALAALDEAARLSPQLKPVTSERRDLYNRPLLARELDRFDGLVFDPPRAGAEDQCRQIAKSKIRRIAAVSCNPGTLARDLAVLIEGGYCIARVTPIDQFLWSPHVEAVALLERGR
ncbi:class I SAM-dependent RNA methyltransferase [Nitratireductor luteus]|uniref:class I SAM-dependent RNA methyltransferase n=1 Tax=Nitratireductor luteus TaxID=2976980 RepID=UPI00223F3933|nr:class I SAM-dependent RNA methyltransferase [Nitratireductor luteus]